MITEAAYRGGAKWVTASGQQLYRSDPRFVTVKGSGGTNQIWIPRATEYMSTELGASILLLCDPTSTSTVVVKGRIDGADVTIATLSAGQALKVRLLNNGVGTERWAKRALTMGAARTIGLGTSAAVARTYAPQTFDPFCFEGSACDLATALGSHPLDGVGGHAKVIVPMYENSAAAPNSYREPVRAADLVMPSVVVFQFLRGRFLQDALHPQAGSMSDELFDALYNNDRPMGLEYLGTAHGTSRNWMHCRWAGSGTPGWDLPAGGHTVKRHVWRKQVAYYPNGGDVQRTLEVRFVVEHSVDPEPNLDGTGGTNDRNDGSWGSVFYVWAGTDEMNPSFADGGTYTPAGASGPVSFTKNDPLAWGGLASVGGTTADTFCHPQMLACAILPTTFHSPAGRFYVPPIDRASHGGQRTRNRQWAYLCSNGAPWLAGGCADPDPAGVGVVYNIVFGLTAGTGSLSCGAMSTGGGFPKSKPTEWPCWENGGGTGQTLLQPTRPGWDNACGKLDVLNGNSGTISICTDSADWPGYEPNACEGLPAEPLEGRGGSHQCFNNGNADLHCCVGHGSANVWSYEQCVYSWVRYGEFNGTDCDIKKAGCNQAGSYVTSISCPLEDYTYNFNGDQDAREISWIGFKPDPRQVFYNFTYAGTADADFVARVGSWSYGATVQVTSRNDAKPIKAAVFWQAGDMRDNVMGARGKKCTQASHGLIARATESGDDVTGYGAVVVPTGGSNATCSIKKYQGATVTVLATFNTTVMHDTCAIALDLWGTRLTATFTPLGESGFELHADDADIDGLGSCGLFTETASNNVEFDQIEFADNTREFGEGTAMLQHDGPSGEIQDFVANGYGKCDSTNYPQCGDTGYRFPPICSCETGSYALNSTLTASWAGPGDVYYSGCSTDPSSSVDGSNPTPVPSANPGCECQLNLGCGKCPPPAMRFSVYLPSSCASDGEPDTALFCRGIAQWYLSSLVAP